MENHASYTNVIEMLKLWATPTMWHDNSLYLEVKNIIKKLDEPYSPLSEREFYLTNELMDGLFEATLASYNKASGSLKDDLVLTLTDINKFQDFLVVDKTKH